MFQCMRLNIPSDQPQYENLGPYLYEDVIEYLGSGLKALQGGFMYSADFRLYVSPSFFYRQIAPIEVGDFLLVVDMSYDRTNILWQCELRA